MKKVLSFVIPCYRSELTIEKVIEEIITTVSVKSDKYDYEIICVNDCSPDQVLSVVKKLAEINEKIKVIDLSKNSGKHAAIMAGYAYVTGDFIINLDDDFQCPTYELWRLLEPVETGRCDCSIAQYEEKKEALWKRVGSNVNMIMANIMLDKPKGLRFENFSIFRRFLIDEIVKYDKPYPYLEGLVFRITNRVLAIPMNERNRSDNKASGFTMYKSISLWLNGFTAFSVKPLRIADIIGFLCAFAGVLMGLIIIVRKLLCPDILIGYSSTMAAILFVGGIIMLILGLIGEYVGRIYICINNSPQYVVRDKINLGD